MSRSLKIKIEKLQIQTKLGFFAEERKHIQTIECDISVEYFPLPGSIEDDNSDDYICYAELAEIINNYCKDKEFKLLEYLTNQIYKILKNKLGKNNKLSLKIKKLTPQMNYKLDSASCEIADE